MSTPEGLVSRAIMDYLAARHIFSVRMNSGVTVAVTNGRRRAIHMNAPGTADILAFPKIRKQDITAYGNIPGANLWYEVSVILWIEVKSSAGKQSEFQKSFQQQVEREGHRYVLARSIEDVAAALK